MYVQIARRLAQIGIGCLRFDCAGFGESEGEYLDATYRSLCRNLDDAMMYLGQRRDVLINQLGIVGHSLGGNIAIDVASFNSSIKGICLLSPNPTEASSRPKIFSKIELDDLRRKGVTRRKGIPASAKVYNPIHAGISFKKASRTIVKTLIVYGSRDPYYSHDQYMGLFEAFKGEKTIFTIDGADHSYIPIETRLDG